MIRILLLIAFLPGLAFAAPATQPVTTCRVTGLFDESREADLRAVANELPGVKLVSVNLDYAEATFAVDRAVAFPDAKPDKIVERLDQAIRKVSYGTFTAAKPLEIDRAKLQRVELDVPLLDCKGCSLAVHEILLKLDGVVQVRTDIPAKKVIAQIDSAKVSKADLIAALQKREVFK